MAQICCDKNPECYLRLGHKGDCDVAELMNCTKHELCRLEDGHKGEHRYNIRDAPVAAEWIDGLPTEPGTYWLASSRAGVEDWHSAHGELHEDGLFSLGLGATLITYGYDFKHKPAPLVPEPPR